MILEWLARVIGYLWSFFLSLMPDLTPPDWFASVAAAASAVNSHMAGLGAWFPFQLLGSVLGVMLLIAAASLVVKVVRIVASFFTAGGGSAA